MVEIVPEASSFQFGSVSEWAMAPAAGACACRACSAFAGLADHRNQGRSGPTAVARWQLAPGSGDFSL